MIGENKALTVSSVSCKTSCNQTDNGNLTCPSLPVRLFADGQTIPELPIKM